MRTALALASTLALLTTPALAREPAEGATTFVTYEAFLSPAQEPGEESETPRPLQKSLGATAPSIPRAERKSRGWGQLRFSRDMSKDMPGLKPSLPESCPVEPGMPFQTRTLAGLERLAGKGVLYFNLHTKAHTYYGEMRGQLYRARD
jgi:hypothetical protein